jgi:L-arabinose isomerase
MPIVLATQEEEIRIVVQSQPWTNSSRDPISKIPTTKKGWQSDPNNAVPAWQMQGPEVKSQYHQNKKKG